ncbi:MAG: DNA-processing protein DprA [Bacteroidota bacterium]|nr:DNA-processing protein DprA [Bacteroidota bacterium]
MADEELYYRLALTSVPNVGAILGKTLYSYFGSAEAIFKATKKQLERVPNVGAITASAIVDFDNYDWVKEELAFAEKHNIQLLFYTDDAYPSRLKKYDQAPLLLYYRGADCLNCSFTVGIVGTRDATDYGIRFTEKLVRELQPFGCIIISGLAYGIDIAAHKAAVKQGMATIGVLGNGLRNIYPAAHKSIAAKMIEHGGILTEYPKDETPDRNHFPERNRIVAALSDALVVVESGEEGGSMITVEYANEYKKPVFALPGLFDAKYSLGCHSLIKNGHAMLIETAADIANYLKWGLEGGNVKQQAKLFEDLLPHELSIVQLLDAHKKLHIDQLASLLDMQSHSFTFTLLDLEMKSLVRAMPGKYYELC